MPCQCDLIPHTHKWPWHSQGDSLPHTHTWLKETQEPKPFNVSGHTSPPNGMSGHFWCMTKWFLYSRPEVECPLQTEFQSWNQSHQDQEKSKQCNAQFPAGMIHRRTFWLHDNTDAICYIWNKDRFQASDTQNNSVNLLQKATAPSTLCSHENKWTC